ncbi:TIGR02221 family CRISPR-associated protein [Polaribacter litorisediminis]|uniref:TIGR02221 family CRISPR-associated protein n=1 Tax=Polaribacter litorisediminis TaxID=1908341 RepID=UPI001CBEED81|nr:TIGR02221 family CRISPR-associated protein [Polaribacter litorisediminis]UAM97264.1 TIGR02221 family CRISPR-associated protein [Polaribacter litorisediminis]
MAKILISFLGTGSVDNDKSKKEKREYRTVKYEIDKQIYEESFVTKVLDTHYNVDKILYIGTLRSMWEEVYRTYIGEDGEFADNYLELHDVVPQFNKDSKVLENEDKILKHFEHQKKLIPILIQYGLNKEELDFNIQQVLKIEELINDGDEVYLDITHSFRSLPLLLMNVLNYLKDVSKKNFEIKGISYGMLDIMRENNYIAPIVQLDVISELHENIKAANTFTEKADGFALAKLLETKNKDLSKLIKNFSTALSLNYSHEIKKQYERILKFDFSELDSIERLIAEKAFQDFKNSFDTSKKNSLFQLDLAKWYFSKKMFGVSYLTLTESIITYAAEKIDFDKSSNEEIRNQAKRELSRIDKELYKLFKSVNKIRNNVAHMLDKRHDTYLNDFNNLENQLSKATRLMK